MVPFGVEHRLNALGESNNIAVIALEQCLVLLMNHADYVYGSDSACLGRDAVEEGDYLFLVGNGYVQTAQIWVAVDNFGKVVD